MFGLGNKTYEHYNSTGIYVDKRLEELGAERVYEIGLGDDDTKSVTLWFSKLFFMPLACVCV